MTRNLAALFATVAATASLLAGCGGGGGSGDSVPGSPPPPPPPVARGTLVAADTNISSKTPHQIDLFGADGSKGPVAPGEMATCGANFRQINYATVDASGATVTASAGLLLPVDVTTGGECSTSRPLITFQHGTSDTNTFEGANAGGTLSQTLAMYFVSHGYVVVVPDYLGYGASIGHYHPYVVAEEEANVVIDAVRAARNWAAANPGTVSLNGQLFLSGTSEGGYVTMAAHRTMERDFPSEFTITADVPVSGPYDLATEVMNDLQYADITNNEEAGSTAFLLSGMQNVYGDLWTSPSEVFQPPWDATAYNLFPSGVYASDEAALNACQIPFNITQSPSRPIGSCARTPLLQASFVADYENAVPGTSGGIARRHVEENGLLQDWGNGGHNRAPMTVCYGDLDPTATLNAVTAGNYFGIPAVDVQTSGPDFITSWMVAVSANPGNLQYHGGIEAPGCTAYARYVIFDSYASIVP